MQITTIACDVCLFVDDSYLTTIANKKANKWELHCYNQHSRTRQNKTKSVPSSSHSFWLEIFQDTKFSSILYNILL